MEKISREVFEDCLEDFKEDLLPVDHGDYERMARIGSNGSELQMVAKTSQITRAKNA